MPLLSELYGNPLLEAANAGRVASRARTKPQQPAEEAEPKEPAAMPPVNKGILAKAGDVGLSGLAMAGNFLDLPGSAIRDVIGGHNPFDQFLTPFSDKNRTTGRDLLRQYGLAGSENDWSNFGTGIAAEMLLDPLTYLGGVGAVTKIAGTPAKKAGLLKNVTPKVNAAAKKAAIKAGKETPERIGWMQSRMQATPSVLINEADDPASALKSFFEAGGTAEMMDKPVYTLAQFNIPWASWIPGLNKTKLAGKAEVVGKKAFAHPDDLPTLPDEPPKSGPSTGPTPQSPQGPSPSPVSDLPTNPQSAGSAVAPQSMAQAVSDVPPAVETPRGAIELPTVTTAAKTFTVPSLLKATKIPKDDPLFETVEDIARLAEDKHGKKFTLKHVMETLDETAKNEGLSADDVAAIGSVFQRAQEMVPTKKNLKKAGKAAAKAIEQPPEIGGGQPPKSGLVPANIGSDGKIYYGNPGDLHFSISERYPFEARGEWTNTGFAGPDGKFLTREQALESVKKNKPDYKSNLGDELDAKDYQEQVVRPEEAAAKKIAASQKIDNVSQATFETSKGSKYTLHPDGSTTRDKAARNEPGHEGQQGAQPKSTKTWFVDPDAAQKLSIVQAKGPHKIGIGEGTDSNGKKFIAAKYLDGPDAGKFIKDTFVAADNPPGVGKLPIEYWDDEHTIHFGNPITKIDNVSQTPATTPPKPAWMQREDNTVGISLVNPGEAKASASLDALPDGTNHVHIEDFAKEAGAPKGSGRKMLQQIIESAKEKGAKTISGNFTTHEALGAFGSTFGKDKVKFVDKETGAPLDIDFAEAMKSPEKYIAHADIEPPKAGEIDNVSQVPPKVELPDSTEAKLPTAKVDEDSLVTTLHDRINSSTESGKQLASTVANWVKELPEGIADPVAKAVDSGANIVMAIPGVKEAVALFDYAVMGSRTIKGQEQARVVMEAIENARTKTRMATTPLVRSIEGSSHFDVDAIAKELELPVEEATKLANQRSMEFRAFVEGIDPIFYDAKAMPQDVHDVAVVIRQIYEDTLKFEAETAGLDVTELKDRFAFYAARAARKPGKSYTRNPLSGPQYETEFPGQKGRKPFLKNLPAGTSVIDELSIDPEISGLVNRAPVIAQSLKKAKKFDENALLPNQVELRQYLYENYGPKLDGDFFEAMKEHLPDTFSDSVTGMVEQSKATTKTWREAWQEARERLAMEDAEALAADPQAQSKLFDPTKDTRFDEMISFITKLDPAYVKENAPLFGRNLLHDTMQRTQDGQAAAHVAMAAQKFLAQNLQIGKVSDDNQGSAFEKFITELKLNTPKSLENIIGHMDKKSQAAHTKLFDDTAKDILDKIAKAEAKAAGKTKQIYKGTRDGKAFEIVYTDGDAHVKTWPDGKDSEPLLEKLDWSYDAEVRELIKQDIDKKFLYAHNAPQEVYDEMTRWMKPFSTPEEIGAMREAINRFSNIFRANVTAPFPGFHVRNLVSGQMQNIFFKAYDPNEWGPMRYYKPMENAYAMRSGKPIVGISKQLPNLVKDADIQDYKDFQANGIQRLIVQETMQATPNKELIDTLSQKIKEIQSSEVNDELLDVIATRKLADEVFAQGLIGSKQGQAAEVIGDTTSLLRSQLPGINTANPLKGEFTPAPPGTTWLDAVNPTNVDGGIGLRGQEVNADLFFPGRIGRDFGSLVEDINRIAPYLAYRKQGYSAKAAAAMVNKIQIDYTKLSSFERRNMRAAMPFYCVPDDHEILTRDGWKRYTELTVGEDVLAYNPETDTTHWKPLLEVATFDFDGELMQWETSRKGKKINFQFTENHRWPVDVDVMQYIPKVHHVKGKAPYRKVGTKRKIFEANKVPCGARLIGSAPIGEDQESCLTPRLAAILGWVVTDGYHRERPKMHKRAGRLCINPLGTNPEMMVYQSPKKHLDEIVALLGTKPRKPHPDTGVVCVSVKMSDIREIKKVYTKKSDLPSIVSRLSREAAAAMLDAMDKAESSRTASNLLFSQCPVHNPHVRDAYQILRTLNGQVANLSQKGCYVRGSRHYNWTSKTVSKVKYTGKIWCPRTELGTWVMRHNGNIVITGNTFSSRMLAMTLQDLFQHPGGRQANVIRVANRSRDREAVAPEYIQQSASVPLGELSDGSQRYITGFGLGLEDPLKFARLASGDVGGTLKELAARSNPLIKFPIEAAMGRSLFYDGPSGPQELTELDPTLGRTISNVHDLVTGERTERAEPFISQGFEHLFSNSPLARYGTFARQLTDPRKLEAPLGSALDLLTGIKVKDVSPAAQDSIATQRAAKLFRQLGGRNQQVPFFPKDKLDELPEEDKQTVQEIQDLLDTVRERRKIRREIEESKVNQIS